MARRDPRPDAGTPIARRTSPTVFVRSGSKGAPKRLALRRPRTKAAKVCFGAATRPTPITDRSMSHAVTLVPQPAPISQALIAVSLTKSVP